MTVNLPRGQWVYNRAMTSASVVRVRIPPLLDVATYLSLVVMSGLALSGTDDLQTQLKLLGLCAIYGLLYRFIFRGGIYEKRPALYFGVQWVVLVLLLFVKVSSSDSLSFLFLFASIHAALVLTRRVAVFWVMTYYLTVSAAVLITRGSAGLFAVAFYFVTYIVCGVFGTILQQAELAREHNQQLVEELQSTQKKLQELAVVDERNRLARDLHDSVKQQVFAISMQLGAAKMALSESDKAYASVTQAERLAQQAGAELTTLIHELRPPSLDRKDLSTALKEHVLEWSRQNEIEVEAKVEEELSASVNVEQALFRVAQEALSNVARHSKASMVSVSLAAENDEVVLTIKDNGTGFDLNNARKGMGLDSMSERLESVGGRLDVFSQRKMGTRIVARVGRS
ncbi:MAG TPA: sensor histidine kinase [Anaerolineales bacterium]